MLLIVLCLLSSMITRAKVSLLPYNPKWTVEQVKQLIEAGADVNEKDSHGLTALMCVAKNLVGYEYSKGASSLGKSNNTLDILIRFGARVNDQDNNGWTPLAYAVRYNTNEDVAQRLLDAGADPNVKIAGKTLLQYCNERIDWDNVTKDNFIYLLIEAKAGIIVNSTSYIFEATTGTLHKYIGNGGDVVVPSSINGMTVTRIGNHCFEDCQSILTLYTPFSIKSIGRYAFQGCTNLSEAKIASNIDDLKKYAFYSCTSLEKIDLPDSIEVIGDYAFKGCVKLLEVSLPSNVEIIGKEAFNGCSSVTELVLPSKLKSVEDGAFEGCTMLNSVTIPLNIKSIGLSAFPANSGCVYSVVEGSIGYKYIVNLKSTSSDIVIKSITNQTIKDAVVASEILPLSKKESKPIVVNALDFWPLDKELSFIGGGDIYRLYSYRIVNVEGRNYYMEKIDALFGGYSVGYKLYNLIMYDGVTWICKIAEYKRKDNVFTLVYEDEPWQVIPLYIELEKPYKAFHYTGLPEFYTEESFTIERVTTKSGIVFEGCLIRESITRGANGSVSSVCMSYVKGRGLMEAKSKGKEWVWDGDPKIYSDTVSNRNYLRRVTELPWYKDEDRFISNDLGKIKSYHKYNDVVEILGVEPYYASPYENGVFGVGGVAHWRANGRDIMVTFSKSDYVDKVIVDEGTFYYKDF